MCPKPRLRCYQNKASAKWKSSQFSRVTDSREHHSHVVWQDLGFQLLAAHLRFPLMRGSCRLLQPLQQQIASRLPLQTNRSAQTDREGGFWFMSHAVGTFYGWREGVSVWYLVMVDIYGKSYWRVGPPYYIDHRPSLVSWTSPDVRPGICNFSSWAFVQTGLAKMRCPKLANTFWIHGMYQNWVNKPRNWSK